MDDPTEAPAPPTSYGWTILDQDDDWVVVNKPTGLAVHRSEGPFREWTALLQQVRDATGGRVHAVHRLDRATSGVSVLARHPEAASRLAAAFREHRVRKTYWAVVRGWPPAEGRVDRPLKDREGGPERAAVTAFRVRATTEMPWATAAWPTSRYAWVEAWPESGRWHQIRRHLRGLAHPVIGDTTHGDGDQNRRFRSELSCHRLMLHAAALTVPHPRDGTLRHLQAPPDEEWVRTMEALGWAEDAAAAWAALPDPEAD